MRRSVAILVLGSAAALLSGCTGGTDGTDSGGSPSPTPSELPTAPAELQAGFEEMSGLILPSNTSDLEIDAKYLDGARPYYELRFVTTRGGAEVVCDAENLGVYATDGPPTKEHHEVFDIQEDDAAVSETVECTGSHPTEGRVQRQVVVVFPEDGLKGEEGRPNGKDRAVVYAYSVLWPSS